MHESELVDQFYTDLQQTIIAEAAAEDDGMLRSEAFTEWAIHELSELGEIEGGSQCFIQKTGIEASGFYLSEDLSRLEIFTTRARLDGQRYTLPTNDAKTALKRAKSFIVASVKDLFQKLEESSEAFDMSLSIKKSWPTIELIKIHLFSDGDARIDDIPVEELDGRQVICNIWDLTRLYRATSTGSDGEHLRVNVEEICGAPFRLFKVPEQSDRYDCYVGAVNGRAILDLYRKYGPRLLERNVRTFLQARGKVNQGIRRSLNSEPEMFVAYNNGLSATCTGCEYELQDNDVVLIRELRELQIVNGGQTTGSIFNAWKKDKVDIDLVWVPIKITEILDAEDIDKIAPLISEYSNTQNRVTTADFSSNDPFHVELEKLSRRIWAPAVDGAQKQSRWFYERSRGQYMDQLSRAETPARKRVFKAENPSVQRFAKTDVAKYEHTWQQLPHFVSRGAQKNFAEFMQRREEQKAALPDDDYFKRLVAKAILFKQADKIVRAQQFGGYKANIVTYTLSWIHFKSAQRVDLQTIWEMQALSDAMKQTIEQVSHKVFELISNPPGQQNVTEYCKKEACWKAVREISLDLSYELTQELLELGGAHHKKNAAVPSVKDEGAEDDEKLINRVANVPAEEWFAIANWAKVTSNLQPWQRSLSFSLGRLASSERKPSIKQARQGEILRNKALELGFVFEELERSG
jgi:hypothetical protein